MKIDKARPSKNVTDKRGQVLYQSVVHRARPKVAATASRGANFPDVPRSRYRVARGDSITDVIYGKK